MWDYKDWIAFFTDDGGTWTAASNWVDARKFVTGVIENSTMSDDERMKLSEIEAVAYDMFFGDSNFLIYTDDEKKVDIKSYSKFIYAYVKDNGYPEQVVIVFASYSETTMAVADPGSQITTDLIVPKWIKYAGIGLVVYLIVRR